MGTKRRTIKNWFEPQQKKRKSLTNDFILMTIVLISYLLFLPFSMRISYSQYNLVHQNVYISKFKSKVIKLFETIWNHKSRFIFSWVKKEKRKYFYFAIIFNFSKIVMDGWLGICKCENKWTIWIWFVHDRIF